ncbi:MAG: hypothetical protein EZS28_017268 [Streblomastix strix]|uniref:Uncharacterized protein n=1 Tax=Streblomastix strix TaxID=222440 RepID=A0A5J4VX53_9EUKA|nr:MAG: hypothetical protein EZS28_017268 [Streblomastix strix]
MQHSDYVAGYMQLVEVLKTLTIHHGSISISKQQFTDQPVTELTSSGVKYTGATLGVRGITTCAVMQTCQVNWTIIILKDTLAIQLNETNEEDDNLNKRIKFNGKIGSQANVTKDMTQGAQKYYGKQAERFENSERLNFGLVSPLQQAAISSNSLSDLCTSNSVSVSPLESIIADKRHCGIFIDILLSDIDDKCDTTP